MLEKTSIREWLGFKSAEEIKQSRTLGSFFGVIILLTAIVIGGLGLVGLVRALGFYIFNGDQSADPSAAARNIGLLLAAAFGAPFVAWQAIVRQKQADVAEQSHIAEVLTKAGENLGAEKTVRQIIDDETVAEKTVPAIEVRSLGLLALERLARENLDFHIQVTEIIAGYVRHNAELYVNEIRSEASILNEQIRPRDDLLTALRILSDRNIEQRKCETEKGYTVSLNDTDFSWLVLESFDFSGIRFDRTKFRSANLVRVNFSKCSLIRCDFSDAAIAACPWEHVKLGWTIFNSATFTAINRNIHDFKGGHSDLRFTTWRHCINLDFRGGDPRQLHPMKFFHCTFAKDAFVNRDTDFLKLCLFENCNMSETGVSEDVLAAALGTDDNIVGPETSFPSHWREHTWISDAEWIKHVQEQQDAQENALLDGL